VPEKKTGLWWGLGCLVATGAVFIVVAVIGILAAIAIPSFVKARDTVQRHACLSNLRLFDSAKEQAALELKRKEGDAMADSDIVNYLPDVNRARVVCPSGGTYTLHPVGRDPECSLHGSLKGRDPGPSTPVRRTSE
jgi:type II secretory pathway pseudopilin PulG